MDIKELFKEQKQAFTNNDFYKLNEINKQIFYIRENKRKTNAKLNEIKKDNLLAQKIERLCTR